MYLGQAVSTGLQSLNMGLQTTEEHHETIHNDLFVILVTLISQNPEQDEYCHHSKHDVKAY